ncbi:hypothetical protein Aperf_G00000093186 [Anoplocephala perfoliata]
MTLFPPSPEFLTHILELLCEECEYVGICGEGIELFFPLPLHPLIPCDDECDLIDMLLLEEEDDPCQEYSEGCSAGEHDEPNEFEEPHCHPYRFEPQFGVENGYFSDPETVHESEPLNGVRECNLDDEGETFFPVSEILPDHYDEHDKADRCQDSYSQLHQFQPHNERMERIFYYPEVAPGREPKNEIKNQDLNEEGQYFIPEFEIPPEHSNEHDEAGNSEESHNHPHHVGGRYFNDPEMVLEGEPGNEMKENKLDDEGHTLFSENNIPPYRDEHDEVDMPEESGEHLYHFEPGREEEDRYFDYPESVSERESGNGIERDSYGVDNNLHAFISKPDVPRRHSNDFHHSRPNFEK